MAEVPKVKDVALAPVTNDLAGSRLDVYLTVSCPGLTRSKAQSLIKDGFVTVNGTPARRPSEHLHAGDVVTVPDSAPKSQPVGDGVDIPLDILHEDELVLVLNKQPGLAVHGGAGTNGMTLVDGLVFYARKTGTTLSHSAAGGEGDDDEPSADNAASSEGRAPPAVRRPPLNEASFRPGIVHRLDKDTTGVLVCAKTDAAHAALARQFHDKTNLREYIALLDGKVAGDRVIESYLSRDPHNRRRFVSQPQQSGPSGTSRYAKSTFRPVCMYGERLTLTSITLQTGRTHQIRIHSGEIGAPVLGDPLYHPRRTNLPESFAPEVRVAAAAIKRQMLHARLLGFIHPGTKKKMVFEAPLPVDFQILIELLEPYKMP